MKSIRPTFLEGKGRTTVHALIPIELQWLKHLWNHENMFETGVVGAKELILAPGQEA